MAVSVILLGVFATAETTKEQLTTGQFIDVSTQLDTFLYWVEAVVVLSVVILLAFAVKSVATDFKSAIGGIAGIAVFALLLVVCYFASGAEELTRVVNGETQFFSESTMKMIDMWIYSIEALIGLTVLLIVGFAAKRAIVK